MFLHTINNKFKLNDNFILYGGGKMLQITDICKQYKTGNFIQKALKSCQP